MDEAAVYGSTMHHLLEEVLSVGRAVSGESDTSDPGRKDANPAYQEVEASAQPPAAAETAAGGETRTILDFDRAWELFGKGEMDARSVLAVLTRIHGDRTQAWWPLVRVALPPGEVSSAVLSTCACMKHALSGQR